MLQAPPKLSNIHILLADGDLYMASIICHMMHTMGFTNITRVANGQKALEIIETKPVDILICEWNMDGMDGIDLAQYMRDPQRSPNLTMPIIMMTGRGERQNVEHARDFGVTEFIVKPVTIAMLFDRIRRIFDNPRDFVIASTYIGPDRRHKANDERGDNEQRVAKPLVVSKTSVALDSTEDPVIVSKNFDLRRKANLTDTISKVVTPKLLEKAQAVITSYQGESSQWINEDIRSLERAIDMLVGNLPGANQQAQNAALSIKSRAGMFGFDMAANVAFALYVFLYHDYKPNHSAHLLIVQKHVEVMKVLLAGRELGNTPQMEQELTEELLKMTAKLKDIRTPPEEITDAIA